MTPRCFFSVLALALAFATPTHATGTEFTYQGYLSESGNPAAGTVDLRFSLEDGSLMPIGIPLIRSDVPVTGGVFSVSLDFGAVFDGSARHLRIEVRPGDSAGAYTILDPPVEILATPYAMHSETAVVAGTVATNGVGSAAIADGTVNASDVDSSTVQRRVLSSCAAGSSIRSVGVVGDVVCEPDNVGTGDITGVFTPVGSGLTGGAASGDVSLSIPTGGVDSAKIADGSIGSIDVNASQVQLRVTPACTTGMTIESISSTGVPTCSPAMLDSYSIPIPTASLSQFAANNCQANSGQSAIADGAPVLVPAGTYLVTMPALANFDLLGGDINGFNVTSTAVVQTNLMRDATNNVAFSKVTYGSGTPAGLTSSESFGTELNATVFTLDVTTAMFVKVTATLVRCGSVSQTSGRQLRLVRLR
ncbi:MAG: hypothetical protein IPK97_02020 [Ahniella sp.]|nr:hypothetical protein [Ahniella sp.]